jgi:hypothetical protein
MAKTLLCSGHFAALGARTLALLPREHGEQASLLAYNAGPCARHFFVRSLPENQFGNRTRVRQELVSAEVGWQAGFCLVL